MIICVFYKCIDSFKMFVVKGNSSRVGPKGSGNMILV